jgi:hypothetical protein
VGVAGVLVAGAAADLVADRVRLFGIDDLHFT